MVRSYICYLIYVWRCNMMFLSVAVAVSALVLQKDSSNIMDKLEQIGATDILLFAINNSRM